MYIAALPPVMVPRQTEIPSKLPELENYALTVPENTDFPKGLSENISIPGKECYLVLVTNKYECYEYSNLYNIIAVPTSFWKTDLARNLEIYVGESLSMATVLNLQSSSCRLQHRTE